MGRQVLDPVRPETILELIPPELRAEARLVGGASGLGLVLVLGSEERGEDVRLELVRFPRTPPQLAALAAGDVEVLDSLPVRRRTARSAILRVTLRHIAQTLALPLAESAAPLGRDLVSASLTAPRWLVPPPWRTPDFPPEHPACRSIALPPTGKR